MKIATWNVNSIRTRLDVVVAWLAENQVDVLCLQETKVVDQDFPKELFLKMGYYTYISGQKAYNGVALISRQPMQDISVGFTPLLGEKLQFDFDLQKRVITGIIDNIRVVNLYVPNGSAIGSDKYEYKLRWLKALQEYLQVFSETDICICGDFNIALEDRDIYNPKGKENHIMSSSAERQALLSVLGLGFKDAFRKFTEESGHFSWWDYRHAGFKLNRGWRIDHHYLTSNLYERAVSCQIDIKPRQLIQPSDHTPVIVEF